MAERPKTLKIVLEITSFVNSSKKEVKSLTTVEIYRFYFSFLVSAQKKSVEKKIEKIQKQDKKFFDELE